MNFLKKFLFSASLLTLAIASYLKGESVELKKYARITSSGSNKTDYLIFNVIPIDLPKYEIFTIVLDRTYSEHNVLQYRGFINDDNEIILIGSFDYIDENNNPVYEDDNTGNLLLLILPDVVSGEEIQLCMSQEGTNLHRVKATMTPYPIEVTDEDGHKMFIKVSGYPEITINGHTIRSTKKYSVFGSGFRPFQKITLNVYMRDCLILDDKNEIEYTKTLMAGSNGTVFYTLDKTVEFGYLKINLIDDDVDLYLSHLISDHDKN